MRVFQTELLNFYYRNLSVLPDYAGYYGYFDSARDRTKVRDIEVIALFTVQLATVGLRQSGLRWGWNDILAHPSSLLFRSRQPS